MNLHRMHRLAGVLVLVLPALNALAATDEHAPLAACASIAAEAERASKARREAVDAGDNAWKGVLPFVVIARKAASRQAADEAQARLDSLALKARQAGCERPEVPAER
jgi:hypothetical protein